MSDDIYGLASIAAQIVTGQRVFKSFRGKESLSDGLHILLQLNNKRLLPFPDHVAHFFNVIIAGLE